MAPIIQVHPDRADWQPSTEPARFTQADSLGAALAWRARWQPHTVAYYISENGQDVHRLTVRELHRKASGAAVAMRRAGVHKGDRVALCQDTSVDLIAALFGAALIGAVPFLVEPPLTKARHDVWLTKVRHMFRVADPRAVVCGPELLDTAGKTGAPVLCAPFPENNLPAPAAVDPEAPAAIQFSSGTTGDAKAIVLSHRSMLEASRAIGLGTPFQRGDVVMGWLPLHHDMGLIGVTLAPFLHGLPGVLMPPLSFVMRPERWPALIHRFRANVSPAPNFGYRLCASAAKEFSFEGLDLSSWRVAFNGAELVDPQTVRDWQTAMEPHGFHASSMRPCYGMAELGLAATFSTPGRRPRILSLSRARLAVDSQVTPPMGEADRLELVSCGRPVHGTSVRVTGPGGVILPPRAIGRVEVCSVSMMSGYMGADAPGTWLDTGDLGFIDDGELFLTGRDKDLVIVAGRNYHPYPFEAAASELPEIRAGGAAAVGHRDLERGTERLVLVVESIASRNPGKAKELRSAVDKIVSARTGVRPDRTVVVKPGVLPRTSSGKLQRGLVATLLADGEL